ncbi:hypothetical protein EWM64_g513 [Hericium alpestre]|uniref:Carbohydrate-binding module family 19 domain-containing protein n=1 Tax=Hericium alpestre TaxID=135208 RepID=A0A4Z0AB74_9AGAM|nr:hypothetical protein EWM64_g513 [Hericium alpestre]
MVRLTQLLFASATIAVASALPLEHQKRIAQTISASTTQWVAACQKAGGADKCGTVSQNAFQTLLAAGKNCDQQDAADAMVDLAKQLNNDPDMIRLAQIFAQQPRNAPDSLQVPYCQTAPKNRELNGLFHCQFSSSDFTKFSGDQTGNTPLGQSAPNPPGSCPAKTDGPVPDGQQLTDLVQSPGTPDGGSAGNSTAAGGDTGSPAGNATAAGAGSSAGAATGTGADTGASATGSAATSASTGAANGADTGAAGADTTDSSSATASGAANGAGASAIGSAATPTSTGVAAAGNNNAGSGAAAGGNSSTAAGGSGAAADSKPFTLDNGKQAQQLNAKFATLTADSPCQEGEQACVGSSFAQCVGGKFSTTACAGGTQCAALPLVNSAGTSVTCSTADQTAQRIAATGATGGVTGSG